MGNSFKTFLKHTAKDFHNQSVNPPVVRASTIIFKSMQDIKKTQNKYLKDPVSGNFDYGRQGTSTTYALQQILRKIEEIIIKILGTFNINCHSREGFTGVWIGNKKIASIGIGCKRWITINGFSINIDCELKNFNKIVPCGIENCLMANMIDYNKNLNIQEVKIIVKKIIQEEFNFDFVSE